MRDPNRIQKFCNRLAKAWSMVPDWRFGQLIFNAISELGKDPFYVEDDKMIEYLEDYLKKNSPYYRNENT